MQIKVNNPCTPKGPRKLTIDDLPALLVRKGSVNGEQDGVLCFVTRKDTRGTLIIYTYLEGEKKGISYQITGGVSLNSKFKSPEKTVCASFTQEPLVD